MNDGPNSVPCILNFPDLGLVGVACPMSAWSLHPQGTVTGVSASLSLRRERAQSMGQRSETAAAKVDAQCVPINCY